MFHNYLPLEKGGAFIWTNLNPLHPRMLWAKFGWNLPSSSWEEDFSISSMYFHSWVIISPLKKGGNPSFEQIWVLITQGCFVPSLVEIGSVVLRRRFFNFVNVFSLFRNYLPLEKGGAHYLNKLESPSPKDALCQVWLKLAQWFWRRRWKCEKFTDGLTDR